jgi:hypothetical protein
LFVCAWQLPLAADMLDKGVYPVPCPGALPIMFRRPWEVLWVKPGKVHREQEPEQRFAAPHLHLGIYGAKVCVVALVRVAWC